MKVDNVYNVSHKNSYFNIEVETGCHSYYTYNVLFYGYVFYGKFVFVIYFHILIIQ